MFLYFFVESVMLINNRKKGSAWFSKCNPSVICYLPLEFDWILPITAASDGQFCYPDAYHMVLHQTACSNVLPLWLQTKGQSDGMTNPHESYLALLLQKWTHETIIICSNVLHCCPHKFPVLLLVYLGTFCSKRLRSRTELVFLKRHHDQIHVMKRSS